MSGFIASMEVTSQALDAGLLQFSPGAVIGTGGFIETPNQRLGIRHELPIVTPEDLAQVALVERDGKTLRIGDVATVIQEAPLLAGDAVINDGSGLMDGELIGDGTAAHQGRQLGGPDSR